MIKLVNKARALAELNSQASLVIPLALPESPLPRTLRLDASSQWHVSALFAAALESATLYTRLRTTDRVYASNLGNMTDLLNVFGKQTIANLEMSIVAEAAPQPPRQNGAGGGNSNGLNGRGENVGGVGGEGGSESGSQKGIATLDIDLSSPQDLNLDPNRRRGRKRHVFSQVLADRGSEDTEPTDEELEIREQSALGLRRRPKVHK